MLVEQRIVQELQQNIKDLEAQLEKTVGPKKLKIRKDIAFAENEIRKILTPIF